MHVGTEMCMNARTVCLSRPLTRAMKVVFGIATVEMHWLQSVFCKRVAHGVHSHSVMFGSRFWL